MYGPLGVLTSGNPLDLPDDARLLAYSATRAWPASAGTRTAVQFSSCECAARVPPAAYLPACLTPLPCPMYLRYIVSPGIAWQVRALNRITGR